MHAWFITIDPVWIIGMCVCLCVCECPHLRLLVTDGLMWHDMDLKQLVKQVLHLLYGNLRKPLSLMGVVLALICAV